MNKQIITLQKPETKKHKKKNPRRFKNMVSRAGEHIALERAQDILEILRACRTWNGHKVKKPRDIRRFARRLRAKLQWRFNQYVIRVNR